MQRQRKRNGWLAGEERKSLEFFPGGGGVWGVCWLCGLDQEVILFPSRVLSTVGYGSYNESIFLKNDYRKQVFKPRV